MPVFFKKLLHASLPVEIAAGIKLAPVRPAATYSLMKDGLIIQMKK
jgi:hypothetical protein